MKKNKFPITRMLSTQQIKLLEKMAESEKKSQSDILGQSVEERFFRECAEIEGISFEQWKEQMEKGEF